MSGSGSRRLPFVGVGLLIIGAALWFSSRRAPEPAPPEAVLGSEGKTLVTSGKSVGAVDPVEDDEAIAENEEAAGAPVNEQPGGAPLPEVQLTPVASPYGTERPAFVQAVAPVAQATLRLHAEGTTVGEDLGILDVVMNSYRQMFKEMPVAGFNAEYVQFLVGQNGKGIQLLPHDHPAINAAGELTDRWGTPYFFHPVSDRQVEIVSAGPDGQLFTDDDVAIGQ